MLIEELAKRANDDSRDRELATSLHRFAKDAAQKAKEHAKRILVQLPEFDLHDAIHLDEVVKNVERIIGQESFSKLSVYELFFLYAASYLHDVGMALPDWELKLIEVIEAEKESDDESWKADFKHSGGPISLSVARQLIIQHSHELYGDFETVSKWYFAPRSENHLVENLAQTMVEYQKFRSGFANKLKALTGEELRHYVQSLRIDFIRQTHHLRSRRYVKDLGRHIPEEIMQPWGDAIARDLANICQAHGEPMSYVEKMKIDAQYVGPETANLQFVASLLRVADIVHFSFDRAPYVLASEMQFLSEESFVHWAVKQQGVNYDITASGDAGKKTVRFRAYCTKPIYYYALHKYLDWVDSELVNYARASRRWELAFGKQASERWSIPLEDEVDRSGIEYDTEKFRPVPGLSFSLEQKQILELLMGVRLYKDKYACLRELYQNSLDACKCMIALSNGKENGQVEFWLEVRGDAKETHLCCMDNGVGMTQDIIVNHLLRIGKSYYTSPAFERLRASYESSFTPTSQFGIGILSCFMIGDRLDIVTIPMQEFSDETSPIKCTVDGVHENFYYAPPDPADLEKIGKHGTIVKIRLTDADLITAENDGKLWLRHFAHRVTHGFEQIDKPLFNNWDRHIHNIVTKFVSLPRRDINVSVKLSDGKSAEIVRWDRIFLWQDFNIDEKDVLRIKEYCKKNKIDRFNVEEALSSRTQVYPCTAEHDGIEFSWLLRLPSSAKSVPDNLEIGKVKSFGAPGLFVDGVHIERHGVVGGEGFLSWFIMNGHLNFTGEARPVLSVDRTSITSWPDSINNLSRELLDQIIHKTISITDEHIKKEELTGNDPLVLATWDYLLSHFSPCRAEFLTTLATDKRYADVVLNDISKLTQNDSLTLREFLDAEKICLPRITYQSLSSTARLLLLGKCGNATRLAVSNSGVCVEGLGLSPVVSTGNARHDFSRKEILLRCDEWLGKFSEYDLVTDFWPIVPSRLFDRLLGPNRHGSAKKLAASDRAIEIERMGNGISTLAEMDPCLVHPRFGLYQEESMRRNRSKVEQVCKVGRFEKASRNHWLFEINDYFGENKESLCVLCVYISPRQLSEEEEHQLREYETLEPEYVKGVREGWSFLFLGREHTDPIILSGVVSRGEMVGAITVDIWQKIEGREYSFIDGTPLTDFKSTPLEDT